MTDLQKLLEHWEGSILSAFDDSPSQQELEDLKRVLHTAKLGAWYHKNQVLIENVLHTAISEMEGSNHPQFHKAIEAIRNLLQDKPRE